MQLNDKINQMMEKIRNQVDNLQYETNEEFVYQTIQAIYAVLDTLDQLGSITDVEYYEVSNKLPMINYCKLYQ